MPRPRSSHPTERELEILTLLWESGPQELGQVCASIRERREVATTTVATMLSVMLEKGMVKRRQGTRAYVWSARRSQETVTRGILGQIIDRAFAGSAARLVAQLVQEGRLSAGEREQIRKLLDDDGGKRGESKS